MQKYTCNSDRLGFVDWNSREFELFYWLFAVRTEWSSIRADALQLHHLALLLLRVINRYFTSNIGAEVV